MSFTIYDKAFTSDSYLVIIKTGSLILYSHVHSLIWLVISRLIRSQDTTPVTSRSLLLALTTSFFLCIINTISTIMISSPYSISYSPLFYAVDITVVSPFILAIMCLSPSSCSTFIFCLLESSILLTISLFECIYIYVSLCFVFKLNPFLKQTFIIWSFLHSTITTTEQGANWFIFLLLFLTTFITTWIRGKSYRERTVLVLVLPNVRVS